MSTPAHGAHESAARVVAAVVTATDPEFSFEETGASVSEKPQAVSEAILHDRLH